MKNAFIDTNVFIYSIDGGQPAKREQALKLVAETADHCAISVQVLQEVYRACDVLLTEDLNDGQMIRGVRVRNPFK